MPEHYPITSSISGRFAARRKGPMLANLREDYCDHDCDWTRRGFWTMLVYRFGQWRYRIRWRPLRVRFSLAYKILKISPRYSPA